MSTLHMSNFDSGGRLPCRAATYRAPERGLMRENLSSKALINGINGQCLWGWKNQMWLRTYVSWIFIFYQPGIVFVWYDICGWEGYMKTKSLLTNDGLSKLFFSVIVLKWFEITTRRLWFVHWKPDPITGQTLQKLNFPQESQENSANLQINLVPFKFW